MKNKALILLIFLLIFSNNYKSISQEYRQEIHCKHFLYGYPFGTPKTNDLIIRDIYALSNNDQTKFADWVAYRLTTHEVNGGLTIERKWTADPWLDDDETLEPNPDDYKNANSVLKTDRGHQAPLASFKNTLYAHQTNYLSNITPQKSDLNQGAWVRLETKVRELVKKCETVYVMTGPLYEKEMPKLPQANETHKVPSGYWKIITIVKENNINIAAFIFDQDTPRNSKLETHLVTVDEIEQKSKLDFFWLLDDATENHIESYINTVFANLYFKD